MQDKELFQELDRISRLLWETPMGVRVRWCPSLRGARSPGPTEPVESYACVYLGRKREVEITLRPPAKGEWLAVLSVACPVDGYLRGVGSARDSGRREYRAEVPADTPVVVVFGRGEFGV